MKTIYFYLGMIFLLATSTTACKKYLEAKSDQKLTVLTSAKDLQSLLDNFNNVINSNTPSADLVSSDEYYLASSDYESLFQTMRNMYTWQPSNLFEPFSSGLSNDWSQSYDNVNIANTVLDNLRNVERNNKNAAELDNIKGQALFLRGYSFYKLVSIFSLAYDATASITDLGVPLRLNSNLNEQSRRASVKETYEQIIADVSQSKSLLPVSPLHVYRSSRPAAYALLSTTFLAMRNYTSAGLYADSCLQMKSDLIDYNILNADEANPFQQFGSEVIYDTFGNGFGGLPAQPYQAKINEDYYSLYSKNDLRKMLFFAENPDGSKAFKGSYEGGLGIFNGLATDEVYLIRAECYARAGNVTKALEDLNLLLIKRYSTGTFKPIVASTFEEVLNQVLVERQKELIYRGSRWVDIKRLNKEGANISLKRIVDGVTYTLPANSLKFAVALPDDLISLSGMQQNPR